MPSSPFAADGTPHPDPFTYIAPDETAVITMQALNENFRGLYTALLAVVGSSPERTLAIRKLQEARMWLNAAVVFEQYREGRQA